MRPQDKVSTKIYRISILLAVVAIGIGAVAAYKQEYIIGGAMLFVLILQIHNILSYKRQHGKQ